MCREPALERDQMHRSMWTYPWDLLDLRFDAALGELRDRPGLNCISLATSYHAGTFSSREARSERSTFLRTAQSISTRRQRDGEGLAIQPKVAGVILEGGDVLRELVRRRDASGLRVSCRTVCLHNTRLGILHPGAVTRNGFGDPNYSSLCLSNPDARAF